MIKITKITNINLLEKILEEIVEMYHERPDLRLEEIIIDVKYKNTELITKMDRR